MERHIEPTQFDNKLTPEELKHLSTCRFCREELADYVERHELMMAPKNMKSSILERSKRPDIQFIAGTNQVSKQVQLFYFSLKVGAAILCVLTMLIAAPGFVKQFEARTARLISYAEQPEDEHLTYYDKVNDFTAQLGKLSMNKEVNYDKKEK